MKKSVIGVVALVAMAHMDVFSAEPIQPIVAPEKINQSKVELGKKLFFDPRISKSGFISCNSCHNLSMGGSDNLPTSIGHGWHEGPINAPTVLNASLNIAQFWDGRAKDLKEQAGGPIANPGEMAFSHGLAVDVVNSIPGYVNEFKTAFNVDKVTIQEITDAIAAFEETLVTPNSRFDLWLQGDQASLTQQELDGYQLFKGKGCIACHNGPAVGGGSYQKMGLVKPFKTTNSAIGRKAVTGKDQDAMSFKVPTLRNIELTYPYFHDGSASTLTDAVDVMAEIQLGAKLSKSENEKIVAFLKSLTGDQPAFPIPVLPPSSEKTPLPEPF